MKNTWWKTWRCLLWTQQVEGSSWQQSATQWDEDSSSTTPPPPWPVPAIFNLLPPPPSLAPATSSLLTLFERFQFFLNTNPQCTKANHQVSSGMMGGVSFREWLHFWFCALSSWTPGEVLQSPTPFVSAGGVNSKMLIFLMSLIGSTKQTNMTDSCLGGTDSWMSHWPEASSAPPPELLSAPPPSPETTRKNETFVSNLLLINYSTDALIKWWPCVCVCTWLTFLCWSLQVSSHWTRWSDTEHGNSCTQSVTNRQLIKLY